MNTSTPYADLKAFPEGLPWRSRAVTVWLGLVLLASAGAALGEPTDIKSVRSTGAAPRMIEGASS
jgi:hypothetical protein